MNTIVKAIIAPVVSFVTSDAFKKRVKSYIWRVAGVTAIAGLNAVTTHLGILELPAWAVTGVGLAVGEATKAINNWMSGK